jgi:hypothetical protein
MAKGKKDKNIEKDLDDEKKLLRDADEEGPESDLEDKGQKDLPESKGKSGILKGLNFRKWWLAGLLILIFIAAGAVAFLRPDLLYMIKGKKKAVASIDFTNDNLQEESLLPFFIPPSADLSRGAVRIDLTVIWDGLASVRFKSSELRIRAEIYDYLRETADKTEDLNAQKSVMEQEMSGIFIKYLGAKDLAIRIKELKFI